MSAQPPPYLQLRDLVKDFGTGSLAVDHVSLDITKGEIFALLGPSGCGKTTLLRMLAGFETPTAGEILLDGQPLSALPPYLRPINMMFQSYALFPHLTVWENVAFGLKREGLPRDEVAARVEALLKLVQLPGYATRKPHQLSGGQQQRVALARSLAKRPQLLLLDEPLGALDKKLREETQVELVNIITEVGVTCVLVTHDQEEAMNMASRMAVMNEGCVLQVGRPGEVYETPGTRFVADFIGNVNLMDGTVVEDEPDFVEIQCADCRHHVGHGITGTVGMAVTVAVRPEKIRLSHERPLGRHNQVQGTIRDKSYFGDYSVYHLVLRSGATLKVSETNLDRFREDAPEEGQEAWASWADTAQVVLVQ
ncbi:MAG: polyamine ABC transporter ATP-binding protein [Anaeromyxobacter sp.]|nr:polyamine ABC transporter ATP-binding protein [Anaeromyxobacter sp.]MBL0276855.1 polyamine ABC transporter ATP-binding protein [Anaeromyxobacter sp.]